MRKASWFVGFVLLSVVGVAGCSKESPPMVTGAGLRAAGEAAAPAPPATPGADASKASLPKTSRKVIRSAELSIEAASPAAAEAKVSQLVERLGGYIASSERERSADEGQSTQARVTLSLRLPAEHLDEALREIKRLGSGAETEKVGSEDVTDEYIDVEARVTNQRHLEEQLVKLLAQASNVDVALRVHQELTTVRTEIDRLEGRRRFLATESSLAKVALSISPLRPVVNASSSQFGVSVRRAASDAIDVSMGVVTFSIRAAGVLLPLALMFGLPTLGLYFWLRRRGQRKLLAADAQ